MKRSFCFFTLGALLYGSAAQSTENASALIEKMPPLAHTVPTRVPAVMTLDPSTDIAEARFAERIESLPVKHGRITKVPGKKTKAPKEIVVVQDVRFDSDALKAMQTALRILISEKKGDLKTLRASLGEKGALSSTPYMQTAGVSDNPRKNLAFLNTQLSQLKNRVFNKKLSAFDLKVQMFDQGHMSLSSYVEMLTQMKDKSLGPKTSHPQIDFFKKMSQMQSKIDFPSVEKERGQVVRRLVYRLDARDRQELRKRILSYRLGDVSHREFYDYLRSACLKTGIKFDSYLNLASYVQYVLLSDRLEEGRFFTELKELEEQRYSGLIIKPAERALVKQAVTLNSIAKIVDLTSASGERAWSKNSHQ